MKLLGQYQLGVGPLRHGSEKAARLARTIPP